MKQATPTTLAAKVESLGEADLLPFHELLDAAMVNEALKAEKVRFNDCIYAPIETLSRMALGFRVTDDAGGG